MRQLLSGDSLTAGGWRTFSLFAFFQPIFLAIFWVKLPPQVPLFFSHSWGEGQLVSPSFLLFLPGLTLVVGGVNLGASRFLVSDPVMVRIFSWTAAIFAILATIAMVKIVFLVT